MNNEFTDALRASLTSQFKKLFIPKLTKAQISRIVLFESVNCSAATNFVVESIHIHQEKCTPEEIQFIVTINDRIRIDYTVKGMEVVHA